MQDKEGFLWFATETGVSRFDGTSFKNFTTAEGLPDNEILKLFVDSKGRVWMMPFKKAVCYYYKGKIHNTENDSILKQMDIKLYVQQMFEDGEGNLFFLESLNLFMLHNNKEILFCEDAKSDTISVYGGGVYGHSRPAVFIGRNTEQTFFYRIKINSNSFSIIKEKEDIRFWGNKMTYTYITPEIIIYNDNAPQRAFDQKAVFYHYPEEKKYMLDFPDGLNLISFINDSIFFYNSFAGAFEYNYRQHRYLNKYLDKENVSSTLRDSEDNLWFTTLGNGVFRLHSRANKNLRFPARNGISRPIGFVIGMNESVLAGADNKLYEVTHSGKRTYPLFLDPEQRSGRVIKMIKRNNTLYLLSENLLYKLDQSQKKFINLPVSSFQSTYKDMDMNGAGEFLFATHQAALSFSERNNTIKYLLTERSTSICSAYSGTYIGTLSGLKFIDLKNQVVDLGKQFPLLKNRITQLVYSENKLWIGTNDIGIVCFDGNKIVKNISIKDGLTGNVIRALYLHNNILWAGTDHGLNMISLSDGSYPVIQKYTISDGLASNMINSVYVQQDTAYVGTSEGLSLINVLQEKTTSNCNLRVLGITVSGKEYYFDSAKLALKKKDNNIRFDFVAISYKSEGNILYYYRLSGIDTSWKTTKENYLQYPTLPSGDYKLQLYAVNKFGVHSEPVVISFIIEKTIFEQTWFIILMILLSIAVIWFMLTWRIKRIKLVQSAKIANAEKIARLEQQALKAQMNPHFIFNCLNSIQQYVIDKDVQGANKFITGFAKLIRQTLDNSGKQNISVAEEESFLRSYLELEKSRFEDKFDYNIHIDHAIEKEHDCLPPMLLQPYIENCIRHGIMHKNNGKGLIDIQFKLKERNLVCSVTDNGVGREAANAFKSMQHVSYQSKGISLTGQRIKMMNKNNQSDIILNIEDLVDSSRQPCGTRITIVVPLEQID